MEKTWSKVQKKLKSFLADDLGKRITYQVTNYRGAHDNVGRAVLLVDKKEVLNMCTIISERELNLEEQAIRNQLGLNIEFGDSLTEQELVSYFEQVSQQLRDFQKEAHQLIKSKGIYSQTDFFEAVERYFDQPIKDSLYSEELLIRIFAILDRRVGKRTLKNLKTGIEQEHELLQFFYNLRIEANH